MVGVREVPAESRGGEQRKGSPLTALFLRENLSPARRGSRQETFAGRRATAGMEAWR